MTIMGLDCSPYQENPLYNQFIDWIKLKADPLNFRFIWIKCSEGTDYESYLPDVTRQVIGAKSVNFEAINLYHYYLYQYMNSVGNWVVLPFIDQAATFYSSYMSLGLDIQHPMTDCEDPLIDQFLQWHDTATINAAIIFARRLNKHLKDYHYALEELFNVKPDIYTGKWWLDKFIPLLISNGYSSEVAWLKEFNFILADYDGTLNIPDYIGPAIAWQKTSTPKPPVKGIPTGHIVAGDALDIDQWLLSDEKFTEWSGGKIMTTLYNTKVPQNKRAKILTLLPNQKPVVPISELNIDAVILPMGDMHNWDGSHWKTKTETTFAGRYELFKGAGIPVLGKFDLDAGSLIAEQHGDKEFIGREPQDNFIIPFLIKAWCYETNWSWEKTINKQLTFRKISALIISEVETTPYGGVYPNDYWQKLIWDYVVYHLRTLMIRGQLPTVPIIMYTGPWWLKLYPNEVSIELQNDKSWLYLQLGQWVRTSTNTFNTLDEIFAFPPDETFKFGLLPDGYFDRVLMHEFTGEAQKVLQITDANNNPTPINLSLWNDTKEVLNSFLALPNISPSSPPVEIDFTTLDNCILDIEAELQKIKEWRSTL